MKRHKKARVTGKLRQRQGSLGQLGPPYPNKPQTPASTPPPHRCLWLQPCGLAQTPDLLGAENECVPRGTESRLPAGQGIPRGDPGQPRCGPAGARSAHAEPPQGPGCGRLAEPGAPASGRPALGGPLEVCKAISQRIQAVLCFFRVINSQACFLTATRG